MMYYELLYTCTSSYILAEAVINILRVGESYCVGVRKAVSELSPHPKPQPETKKKRSRHDAPGDTHAVVLDCNPSARGLWPGA